MPHDHAVRPAASRTAAGVPLLALAGLVVLLGALTATIGVRPTGWLAGMAVGVTTCVLVTRPGDGPLTRADRVTLARAMLVAAVTALVVDGLFVPVPVGVLVPLTCLALVLDFVDGRVARRAGQVTARGARFDMETDAFLILVLSLHAGATLGWWVLAIGVMRYAAWAAAALVPALRRPVPPRYWRKVVAAVQGVTLTVVAAQVLPRSVSTVAVVVALALLVESFGRDIVRQLFPSVAPAPRPAPARGGT